MRSGLFVLLCLFICVLHAGDRDNHDIRGYNMSGFNQRILQIYPTAEADSLGLDSAQARDYIASYENFKKSKYRIAVPDINPFTLKLSMDFFDYRVVTDSDLYNISHELYEKYYRNDILLWNYRSSVYLNMNLGDLQSSRGLIKLEIPLSNLPTLLMRRSETLYRNKTSR